MKCPLSCLAWCLGTQKTLPPRFGTSSTSTLFGQFKVLTPGKHIRLIDVSISEVKFVHPVSPGGSVKFVASGVNFSIFTHFLCFFLLKLLKLGKIDGVKFLAWKSDGVKFLTNSMSAPTDLHFSCFFFVLYFCSQQKWMLQEEIYPGHPDHWHWTNFCGDPS